MAWEAAAAPAEDAGIRVATIRTGIVLDAHGWRARRAWPRSPSSGCCGKLGSGKQWMSWISLADEVGAIRFLFEHDVHGPVNLTAPTPVTNAELHEGARPCRSIARRSCPCPSFGPKLLLGSELAEALLFDGQRVLPEVLMDAGYRFRHDDLETALQEILG